MDHENGGGSVLGGDSERGLTVISLAPVVVYALNLLGAMTLLTAMVYAWRSGSYWLVGIGVAGLAVLGWTFTRWVLLGRRLARMGHDILVTRTAREPGGEP